MEGLFQQFIAQSGAPYAVADYTTTENIEASRAVAEMLGCAEKGEKYQNKAKVEKIIACLRKVPQEELLKQHLNLNYRAEEVSGPWIDGKHGILPYGKDKLLKKVRKIPGLLGTVTAEFRDARYVLNPDGKVNYTRLTELCSQYAYTKRYHQPEKFIKEYNVTQFFDDDCLFYVGTSEIADAFSNAGADIFVYSYDYWGTGRLFNKYNPATYLGPSHSEDYVYILGLHRNDSLMTEKDFLIERIYTGMLANFVNHGNPSYSGYSWKPWTPKQNNYFLIDFDKYIRMPGEKKGYYAEANSFWREYLPKKIGGFTSIDHFPPKNDVLLFPCLINYMLAAWTGVSHHHDKTYDASMAAYELWDDFVTKQRGDYLKNKIQLRGEVIADGIGVPGPVLYETAPADGFSWLTLSLALAVVVLASYIAIVKVLEYRKRKDYHSILQ